ncbi:MAG: hypothetical protein ACKERG_02465 [Candidatus Hodgkinia cicadicola]
MSKLVATVTSLTALAWTDIGLLVKGGCNEKYDYTETRRLSKRNSTT